MQLRKRVKLADDQNNSVTVQQQVETADYQDYQIEEENGQDIQIELDGADGMDGIVEVVDDVFEQGEIFEKGNE